MVKSNSQWNGNVTTEYFSYYMTVTNIAHLKTIANAHTFKSISKI